MGSQHAPSPSTSHRHFGKEIIANRLQIRQGDQKIETLWLKLYKEFIEAIDAIDNGINLYPTDLQPRYRIRTDVSARVGYLNPAWNEPADAQTVDVSPLFIKLIDCVLKVRGLQSKFLKASTLVGTEFLERLDYYANAWLPARDLVLAAFEKRKQVDQNGRIILFEQFAPWKVRGL